jgi:hypothetical protein
VRADSFGASARIYDARRPRYPDQLIDDLVSQGAQTVSAPVPGSLLASCSVLIPYQALRHHHTARVRQGSRANGLRTDSGQAITIGQLGVQDYDVEAEARAMR